MLALQIVGDYVHLYKSGGVNMALISRTFMTPTILFQIHHPVSYANAVAVQLPNAMECYDAVPKLCQAIQNGL